MTGALAALLLAGLAPEPVTVPVDLATLTERAEELDGRWVVFDGYVSLLGDRNGNAFLAAIPGEPYLLPDGRPTIRCSNDEDASYAVIMRDAGVAPLGRRAARPRDAYAGVTIRAIFRNRPTSYRMHGVDLEWAGMFDDARIVRVTGRNCPLHLPEGALPPPG